MVAGDKIGRRPPDPVVPLWLIFAVFGVVVFSAWLVFSK